MATDATGAPTTLGIPKFNTSADAPSGLGGNAQMDALDALIAARVGKPSGIVTGEVPVWNGSTWVRSSETNIGPASLGSGTPDATKFLRGDAVWAIPVAPSYRKTTSKTVNTTVATTDLLNGEITVAAGVMGTAGLLRLTAWGDWLQNSGGVAVPPRLQLVLGGTTLLDSGALGAVAGANAARQGWRFRAEILNLGAANLQVSNMDFTLAGNPGGYTVGFVAFATGEGSYQTVIGATLTSGVLLIGEGVNPSTAVDTSAAKLLALNVINGSASATYETKLLGALVEIV